MTMGPLRVFPSTDEGIAQAVAVANRLNRAIGARIGEVLYTVYPGGRLRKGGWRTKCLDAAGRELLVPTSDDAA